MTFTLTGIIAAHHVNTIGTWMAQMRNQNSVNAPHGAEAAPQAGDVSGAVGTESDGVERRTCPDRRVATEKERCHYAFNTNGPLRRYHPRRETETRPFKESTAPASSPVPEVTGA